MNLRHLMCRLLHQMCGKILMSGRRGMRLSFSLMLSKISKLRYELCPRVMKERRFWRIYFTLVSTHVAPYEKQYMEEIKLKAEEQIQDEKSKQSAASGESSTSEMIEKNLKSRVATASSAEQDLDTFLLGDLEDSDGGPDYDDGDVDGDGSFGDDFDTIGNSDIEDEKHVEKANDAAS